MREREGADPVVGDVALDPRLGLGELGADRRLGILARFACQSVWLPISQP